MKTTLFTLLSALFFAVATHAQTNLTWDPGTSQTGTAVYVHSDTNAGLHLFQVTTTNTASSVGYWRTVLNVSGGEADLYISTSVGITTNSYTEKSDTPGSDRIVRSLTPGQTWYLLVASDSNSVWSIFAGDMHVEELTWDPGALQSGTEVYTHPNTREDCYLFRITTTNTAASQGYWRTVLTVSGADANLYTDDAANVATNNHDYRSEEPGSDTIIQPLTAGQTKYIMVEAEEGASWSLFAGDIHLIELTWDPGTADAGTEVFTNLNADGGAYYFKITTENADLAAWRTALDVFSGEADLLIRKNALPYTNSYNYSYFDHSGYVGDDGFTYYLSESSGAGQEWYIAVLADTSSTWTLLSGDVYAEDLGALATNSASSSGLATIPPEGIRYFKTTIPVEALAWRLWVKDASDTSTLNEDFYVRESLAPHPSASSRYDRMRNGQGLLVPTYLDPGGASFYFVGIPGLPGDQFQLDSRQHAVTDTAYNNTLTNQTASGFLFKTYRIEVPTEQIAWEVTVGPDSGTDPDMAIRRDYVPNAFNNDAFSEVDSTTTSDSATLVPPTLSDGTFYVTVYGDAAFDFNLRNREPVITQIDFNSSTTNDDPARVGWRYFAVSDIGQQLGQLGWLLELSSHIPGTEIAIRRNYVPGRRYYRQNGSTTLHEQAYNDQTSTLGFLQDPEHEADVWYVGIYYPDAALGSFMLDSGSFAPTVISTDGSTNTSAMLPPKSWHFYYVDIPAQTNGQDVIGWELRTIDWTNSRPYMAIRRDQLPEGLGTWNYPRSSTGWNSGNQWTTDDTDWSGYSYNSSGTQAHPKYLLSMGMGRPLEVGSYYIGFYNNSSTVTGSYSFTSSLIGTNMTYEPQPIAFNGGSNTIANLPARDVTYFKVDVPAGQPSWKLHLENSSGETAVYIRKDYVPTRSMITASTYSPESSIAYTTLLQKDGDEHFTFLPASGESTIPEGTYYLMVVSEGQGPSGNNVGMGSSSAVLHSLGNATVTDIGLIPNPNVVTQAGSYAAGEIKLYEFEVPTDVLAMEITLENVIGEPEMNLRTDTNFPSGASYGSYSGHSPDYTHGQLITIPNPTPGIYSLMVNDKNNGAGVSSGSYTIRIETSEPANIVFEGGGDTNVVLPPKRWTYYKVEVPAQTNGQDVLGWELRTTNWSGSRPYMSVRRDLLPEGLGSWNYPRSSTGWNSGNQWTTSSGDWSGYTYNLPSSMAHPKYLLSMGMGRPLEMGTYYIGFFNNSSTVTGIFSFVSSAIGTNMTYEPQPIAFNGGSNTISNLAPREVVYFTVDVPAGQPSWKLRLENTMGETKLHVRKGYVPTWSMITAPTYSPDNSIAYTTELQKTGDEHFIMLPDNGETTIPEGRYYLMVTSEGQNPSGNYIGTNTSGAVLHSLGNAASTDLGMLPTAGETSTNDNYVAGEVRFYRFEVPTDVLAMEVRLENVVGDPEMNMRTDTNSPNGSSYGSYSGYSPDYTHGSIITLANPDPGHYTLMVNDKNSASSLADGSYTLRIITSGTIDIAFDGGGDSSVILPPKTWTYYKVEVPAQTNGQDVIGWEFRTTEWSGYRPHIAVRRDLLPSGLGTWNYPRSSTSWSSGNQWTTSSGEWSGYTYTPSGSQAYPQYLISMGMGAPLSVGTYYVGFYNNSTTITSSFSFASSAIGNGMTYDPQPLAFTNGMATISNLAPRDVAYFKVQVPNNTANWKVKLENTSGETALFIREGYVPTWSMIQNGDYSPGASFAYMPRLQKPDNEHYLLLPENGETTIPAGLYYLMVVGEGENPSGNYIGTNTSSAILHSLGEETVVDLGNVPLDGSVEHTNNYEAGEVIPYRFTVQSNSLAIEVRLEDVTGDPGMVLRTDGNFAEGAMDYGLYAGYNQDYFNESIITVPNPVPGIWSVIVGDPDTESSLNNSFYRLVVEETPPLDLNFDASLNTNGNSNVASGLLEDDQRDYYRVDVPASLAGEPVLGWYLTTDVTTGEADVRVRKDFLPQDSGGGSLQTPFKSPATVIVPPLLTPGTWYVEVKGDGATDYTLTSSAIHPERSWVMSALGETNTTPGVADPLFGDSGVNEAGNPLPVDQGVDLDNGFYHFYEVTVPDSNAGLLKTQLEAISGNPNLYMRVGYVPTLDHDESASGSLYDHRLNSTANTEYGNWVPYDGRYEMQLEPGTWYIMVKAESGSNARYRLKLFGGNVYSNGNVQALDLETGSYTGQLLAEDDWRHYRVEIPTNAPVNWDITYSQVSGNVDLYIRDTVPAGYHTYTSDSYIRHWDKDLKNNGTPQLYYQDTGTHTINMPPMRPGHIYYLSFLARADASFSVSSAVSGGAMPTYENVDFETGSVTTNIPPGATVTYQVDCPVDAVRWIHSITNSGNNVYLEQGTLPSQTTSDHWYELGDNDSLNKYLLNNGSDWPWKPGYTYYFTVHNPTANPAQFILVMSGSLAVEIPQNLNASDGTYADRIYLNWNGLSGVSSYEVWRNTVSNKTTAVNITSSSTSSYSDYSAAPGQLYYYWVSVGGITDTAWFSNGDSGWIPGIGSINPSTEIFTAEGGVSNIVVTAGAGVHWTAVEGLSWVSILSGTPGTNNGTVAYSVGVHAGTTARTGTVTVAGQTFTVIQEAFDTTSNVMATDGNYEDRTEITWDPVLGATRYYLYRGISSNELSASYIGYVTTNIFNDIGGALGQIYYYWVRPYNGAGYGGYGSPDTGFRSDGVPPVSWKMLHFPGGYPGDEIDSDGDGYTNLEEFIAETIPTNALSYFQIDDIGSSPAGSLIYWTTASGRVYGVSWTDKLTNTWMLITNGIPYPQGIYTDTVHSVGDEGFYSMEVELE